MQITTRFISNIWNENKVLARTSGLPNQSSKSVTQASSVKMDAVPKVQPKNKGNVRKHIKRNRRCKSEKAITEQNTLDFTGWQSPKGE